MTERYKRLIAFLRPVLSIWFFVGMPLSMLLSGLYFFFGISQPPLLYFLASMTYLSGGVLGGLWSGEHMWKHRKAHIDLLGPLCVFIVSGGFLCVGIVFAVIAYKHL
jgi:hypothetical protein